MKGSPSILLFALFVLGCGGGGGAGTGGGGTSEAQYGPFSVTQSGRSADPVVSGGGAATVTTVFGASYSDIRLKLPSPTAQNLDEALSETTIAYSWQDSGFFHELGSGRSYPVTSGSMPAYVMSYSGLGDKFVVTENDGGDEQLYIYNADGTGRTKLTSGAGGAVFASMSPDGSKVLFIRRPSSAPTLPQVMMVSTTGGTITRLTATTDYNTLPSWSPDGSKIIFTRRVNNTGDYFLCTMNADGSNKQPVAGAIPSAYFVQGIFSSDGKHVVYFGDNGVEFSLYRNDSYNPRVGIGGAFSGLSASPIGNRVVYSENNILKVYDFQSSTLTELPVQPAAWPSWGPYVQERRLVGVKGPLGPSAAGFSYSIVGSKCSSFVSYDALTRSTIQVVAQGNTGSENVVLHVSADKITSLKYMNEFRQAPVTVVANTAGNQVKGALVAFDSRTGDVASVATIVSSSAIRSDAGVKVRFQGEFAGVWDSKGKNIAPSGAKTIDFDPVSGEAQLVR